MDSSIDSAAARNLLPVSDGALLTPDLRGSLGDHAERENPACAGSLRPAMVEHTPPQPATANGDPTAALYSRYWQHLQSFLCVEADVFSPSQLLEILLQFGRSRHEASARAVQLLDRFGSLSAVVAAEPAKLAQILKDDGVSVILLKAVRASVKAIVREPLEDRPVISSISALMDYLSVTMRHEPIEATRILFLDRKNALIKDEIQHRGTVDHTPLYPREVVKRVLELGASAIILVHNHPSGDPTPSPADVEMTRQVAAALRTINVVLHDHVIVGRNREISLQKMKLI